MKQLIRIGFIGQNRSWEQLLNQIGVNWSRASAAVDLRERRFSCCIVNRDLSDQERQNIELYLSEGGSLLDTSGQFMDQKPVTRYFDWISPNESEPYFSHIETIPIFSRCISHPSSAILGGLAWSDPDPKRSVMFTGLPVHLLWNHYQTKYRAFSSSGNIETAERVSKHQSYPFFEVISTQLRKLHQANNLPFVHKWWSPEPGKQAATFRIDSDYGSARSMRVLCTLLQEYNISSTWFLHVAAHEDNLSKLLQFINSKQEISLHCYRHFEYRKSDSYITDIKQALDILHQYGIDPAGYAAPYGWWSGELAQALSSFSFQYSSEFSYDYDSLPSRSPFSGALQLPVHPISAGSFQRFGHSGQDIITYYNELLKLKQLQHQPVHLFHHPNDGRPELLKQIFSSLKSDAYAVFTYSEWYHWWLERQSASFLAEYDTETQQLTIQQSGGSELPLAVHLGDHFHLTTSKEGVLHLDEVPCNPYIDPKLCTLALERRSAKKLDRFTIKKDQFLAYLWRNRT